MNTLKCVMRVTSKCLFHLYAIIALVLLFMFVSDAAEYESLMYIVARSQAKALILLSDSIVGGLRL